MKTIALLFVSTFLASAQTCTVTVPGEDCAALGLKVITTGIGNPCAVVPYCIPENTIWVFVQGDGDYTVTLETSRGVQRESGHIACFGIEEGETFISITVAPVPPAIHKTKANHKSAK